MTTRAKDLIFRVILPPLLGALGALFANLFPVFHQAFCTGGLL